MLTGAEHWALETAEAKGAAKAIENVARHYPNVAASQKIVDWVMLAQALGFMYGPRIMLSVNTKKDGKPEKIETLPNVSQLMRHNNA